MMGGTDEQGTDAEGDEFPVHSVTLDDFYIGKYEVTRALYKAVMGGDPEKGDDIYPVLLYYEQEIDAFITKLREITGLNFYVPTEAEWEYAARGGNKSKNYKYSGSNYVDLVANYNENAGVLRPVGTLMNNELGIYDMSGNVAEWCIGVEYTSAHLYNPQLDAVSPDISVVRGGEIARSSTECRVSDRHYRGNSNYYTGLRLVIRP